LNDTLGRDSEVFLLQLLFVLLNDEVVGTERGGGHGATVTVKELDGDVDSVLGEEGNGLLTGLNFVLHVPDGSSLANEVGLAQFSDLVVLRAFGLNDIAEVVELESVLVAVFSLAVLLLIIVFLIIVHHLAGHGRARVNGVAVHVVLDTLGGHLHVHAVVEAGL